MVQAAWSRSGGWTCSMREGALASKLIKSCDLGHQLLFLSPLASLMHSQIPTAQSKTDHKCASG